MQDDIAERINAFHLSFSKIVSALRAQQPDIHKQQRRNEAI